VSVLLTSDKIFSQEVFTTLT